MAPPWSIKKNDTLSFGGCFDYEGKKKQWLALEAESQSPTAWDNPERTQSLGREKKQLETITLALETLERQIANQAELLAWLANEPDEAILQELQNESAQIENRLSTLEFNRMFNNPLDANDCFVDFQAGSGGTEAQDWAQMIERMILRYCETKNFQVELLERSDGEVAGIKSASYKVAGDYAYGTLRTETGVHRLVRKSPFDANNRRHTSFASIFVYPVVDDSVAIEINPADLRIDTYRASGAGGQHVNRTDSAVRITHIPTNIVVQCQNDRSQHRNRAEAMNQLRAKLYELEMRKRLSQQQALEESKTDIGWGHQIRSYVLDQSRIKDLRTGVETGNTVAVLDGALEPFITASLKQGV